MRLQYFLYVSQRKKIAGIAVAESVDRAAPLVGSSPLPAPECAGGSPALFATANGEDSRDSVVELEATAACRVPNDWRKTACGINRVWVHKHARHKGVATRLLDAVRASFVFGYTVPKEELAFSQPTPKGKAFATCYFGTPSFLVY